MLSLGEAGSVERKATSQDEAVATPCVQLVARPVRAMEIGLTIFGSGRLHHA